ncbi:MAG: formimidoylglutamate deiminase [Planctomycetota bacterium]|jgi:formimidoylglutamate deiminase
MDAPTIIEPDLTWLGSRFERNVQVVLSPDGKIEHVGILGEKPSFRLRNRAMLPGFVNAHSHAFQRGLRGQGERFPHNSGSFWTWREAMYGLVGAMTADRIYQLSLMAFREMLAAGMTTVGEFHYLHHDESGEGYAFDQAVLSAAADAGIRMVMLTAYYRTGGIGKPLEGAQLRFQSEDPCAFWKQVDVLQESAEEQGHTLGVVVHSIRAATVEELVAIHRESVARAIPFHIHIEEQQREITDCVNELGRSPLRILNDELAVDHRLTAVHCTHSTRQDLEAFTAAGGNVCLCPLTEANLGDGLARVSAMFESTGQVCIGTDSNLRICMTEEMRLLEYGQRLRHELRGAVRGSNGSVSESLIAAATEGGARSLGLRAGTIKPGYLADFVAIDLECPALAGWTSDTLLDAIVFGTGNEAIADVCVGGKWHNLVGAGLY